MARSDDLYALPSDLPVPEDDGACVHLRGMRMPSVKLRATGGSLVDVSKLPGRTIVYCYPRTGRPDQEIPKGWNDIPGARGCTPQSCAFR
ncbi:MAG TPA: peroxiredoxin, partial [Burkholderiales bacterium]